MSSIEEIEDEELENLEITEETKTNLANKLLEFMEIKEDFLPNIKKNIEEMDRIIGYHMFQLNVPAPGIMDRQSI